MTFKVIKDVGKRRALQLYKPLDLYRVSQKSNFQIAGGTQFTRSITNSWHPSQLSTGLGRAHLWKLFSPLRLSRKMRSQVMSKGKFGPTAPKTWIGFFGSRSIFHFLGHPVVLIYWSGAGVQLEQ